MKSFINWITDSKWYLKLFCGYTFKKCKSQHLCRIDDAWKNDLMINGWDIHRGVDVDSNGKFYIECFKPPLWKQFEKASSDLGYDVEGYEFQLMGINKMIDWSKKPSWVYFSKEFKEYFNLNAEGSKQLF